MTKSPARTIATVLAIPAVMVVAAGITFVILFWIAIQPVDGDTLAVDRVEHVAAALADDLSDMREPVDAETVAAEWFHSRAATVEPLTWTGAVGTDRTATIEARITAAVAESSTGGGFAQYTSAGSAVGCYRFTVGLGDGAGYESVPCDALPESTTPASSNRPSLPDDAAERVEEVLASSPGNELADLLRAEFPGAEFTIDTEQAADGELGCSTQLYTAPPQ